MNKTAADTFTNAYENKYKNIEQIDKSSRHAKHGYYYLRRTSARYTLFEKQISVRFQRVEIVGDAHGFVVNLAAFIADYFVRDLSKNRNVSIRLFIKKKKKIDIIIIAYGGMSRDFCCFKLM